MPLTQNPQTLSIPCICLSRSDANEAPQEYKDFGNLAERKAQTCTKAFTEHSLFPPGEVEVEMKDPADWKIRSGKLVLRDFSDDLGKRFRGSSSASTIPVCVKGIVQHVPFPC